MNPLRLYIGEGYRQRNLSHIPLLYPFWGVIAKETMPYVGAAMRQRQYRKEFFEIVHDISLADFILVPHNYWMLQQFAPHVLERIVKEAQKAKKPLLIDATGDRERTVHVPHSVVLRWSQYRYSVEESELTMALVVEDLLESYCGGAFTPRKKGSGKPTVAFSGWGVLTPWMRLKTHIKELPVTLISLFDSKRVVEHKGVLWREKALQVLRTCAEVETHFRIWNNYSGHTETLVGSAEENRKAFVQNILDSDYALAVRGDANASYRFYEALSLGRIPLVLDTELVLPISDIVRYEDFCVIVPANDVGRIGEKLAAFHRTITPERFEDMQRKARAAFAEHLRVDAFTTHLHAQLREHLKKLS